MDIISYGAASKERRRAETLAGKLGDGVEGTSENLQERLKALTDSMDDVTRLADNVIVRDAVNLMKAEARLNTIVQAKKYGMEHMVFDDLLDLSGIDTVNSTGFTYDAVKGEIMGGTILTKKITVNSNVEKILIVDDIDSSSNESTAKIVYEIPYPSNPDWSRIGVEGSLGVIVSGQSIRMDRDISLKSIGVFMGYDVGEPGDITLWIQEGTSDPTSTQAIAHSKIPSFRDKSPKNYFFEFEEVVLKKDMEYLLYFTTTLNSGAPRENYKLYVTSERSLPNSRYYSKNGVQQWKENNSFNISFSLNEEEKKDLLKSYSIDQGVTWSDLNPQDSAHQINMSMDNSTSEKDIILKFELPVGGKLNNYGLIWT